MDSGKSRDSLIDAMLQRLCYIPYRTRWQAHQMRLGQRASRQRGEGLEFDQIKAYQAGEGIRRVNWAATARTGYASLFVNSYYDEKDLTILILVDLSGSMDFGSARLTKKALAAELSASLVYSALACNDRIGLLGFTSEVACYFPPGHNRSYQWMIPEAILSHDSTCARANFGAVAQALQVYLKRRSLVFLLSDFLTEDMDGLMQALELMRRQHDLRSLWLTDPREHDLPVAHAIMRTQDLETGDYVTMRLSRRNCRRMAQAAQAHQERLHAIWQELDIAYTQVAPESDYETDITHWVASPLGRGRR
ncbi:MAG: hypothetical protein ETSY1_06675 [Candidatus Entotheonella factor]|uniref:DUF58 domain-containing protein n=1 Tax=Entotheonella factor TaxID=1429438 RepID=W4LW87_ENTF1|nr:MAG: hypothetical protein ETSY1_06675 [Candidatus Entotheonella factor]